MLTSGSRLGVWFARTGGLGLVVALCPPVALGAQVADTADDEAWTLFEATVRAEVAQRWDVASETLVLEWGPHSGVSAQAEDASPELIGSGANGQWVVRVESARGTVGVRLRTGVVLTLPTAAHALTRGHVVQASDIQLASSTHWGLPTTSVTDGSDIVGWIAQRQVMPGAHLTTPTVAPPAAVKSGDPVEVHWSTGSVRLTLTGQALGSARSGESVLVRLETGKRLRGTAQADGSVSVLQPRPLEK